jgi:hypothetical protein
MSESIPVVACSLTRDDLAEQAARWRRLRAGAGIAREPTADGLRLTFRPGDGVAEELRALVAVENRCCAWARWEVREQGDVVAMVASSTGAGVDALHRMFVGD